MSITWRIPSVFFPWPSSPRTPLFPHLVCRDKNTYCFVLWLPWNRHWLLHSIVHRILMSTKWVSWLFSLTGEGDISLSRKHWIDFQIALSGSSLLLAAWGCCPLSSTAFFSVGPHTKRGRNLKWILRGQTTFKIKIMRVRNVSLDDIIPEFK